MADLEKTVLQTINNDGIIADSDAFATSQGVAHNAVVGVMKSLLAHEMITSTVRVLSSAEFFPLCTLHIFAGLVVGFFMAKRAA